MWHRIRSALTYANVMSTIAVFGVLGGAGAYAANTIGSADIIDESILSADIRNKQVKVNDIAEEAVSTGRIRKSAVRSDRIQDGSVTGDDILESSLGTIPNADRLDGKHASDFAPAGHSHGDAAVLVAADGKVLFHDGFGRTTPVVRTPAAGVYCLSPAVGLAYAAQPTAVAPLFVANLYPTGGHGKVGEITVTTWKAGDQAPTGAPWAMFIPGDD